MLIIFMLPYYSALFHRAEKEHYVQFTKARQVLAQMLEKCSNLEKKRVIAYALKRYDKLGPFDVSICSMDCAGANVPWCPGITVNPEYFDRPMVLALIILHEAAHDYPPYLGHTQHKRLGIW
jgi:hypothetical protein